MTRQCQCELCGARFEVKRKPRISLCWRCRRRRWQLQSVCQTVVGKAVRQGRLPPARSLVCVDCGAAATDYDHRDYARPLAIEPTCRSCNLRRGAAAISLSADALHAMFPDRICDACGTDHWGGARYVSTCWKCNSKIARAYSNVEAFDRFMLRPDIFGEAPATPSSEAAA